MKKEKTLQVSIFRNGIYTLIFVRNNKENQTLAGFVIWKEGQEAKNDILLEAKLDYEHLKNVGTELPLPKALHGLVKTLVEKYKVFAQKTGAAEKKAQSVKEEASQAKIAASQYVKQEKKVEKTKAKNPEKQKHEQQKPVSQQIAKFYTRSEKGKNLKQKASLTVVHRAENEKRSGSKSEVNNTFGSIEVLQELKARLGEGATGTNG